MQTSKAYLDLPEEFLLHLDENNMTLEDFLETEGIPVQEIASELDPAPDPDQEASRAVFTTIIAGAAALMAVGSAINKVVKTVNNRPRVVEQLEIAKNDAGEAILDGDGKPIMLKKSVLLESSKTFTDQSEISGAGIVMKWGSSEQSA